jgi:hypothetical protein
MAQRGAPKLIESILLTAAPCLAQCERHAASRTDWQKDTGQPQHCVVSGAQNAGVDRPTVASHNHSPNNEIEARVCKEACHELGGAVVAALLTV